MALFALDEGFPDTIFEVAVLLPGIELRRVRNIDPRLVGNSEDWAVLLRLHQHPDPFDGLLTTDASMHKLPKEMAVLHQTKLTLVQVLDVGNDAVRATALALLHLPHIARETRPDRPQWWPLRPPGRRPAQRAIDALGQIARKQRVSTKQVLQSESLSDEELSSNLWDWYEYQEAEY